MYVSRYVRSVRLIGSGRLCFVALGAAVVYDALLWSSYVQSVSKIIYCT